MQRIDANTQIFGIIGYPLSHTFSPAMHNAAFEAMGINAIYLVFPMKNLYQLKHAMRQFHIKGLSVTIPHKITVRRLLDTIDPLALQIGSVNTIVWNEKGLLEGHNTDGIGALWAIRESGFSLEGKKVLVIGTGGSARAICFTLSREKISQLGILGRNRYKLVQLAKNLRLLKSAPPLELIEFPHGQKMKQPLIKPWRWRRKTLHSPADTEPYDLIIQTTPLGMSGHEEAEKSPLLSSYLFPHQTVFDIVYNPHRTPFLELALKRKCQVIYGYKMLLHQGVRQFELFTGVSPDIKTMEKALLKVMAKTHGK
ncbi:MAG: shikimate dehydrogenase [Leptospiraceae bacterium]|nr:shikimate dehydrogenase [Leptospiraceae bacterium]MDW8306199.1 shikimate dehydrogenase [Leptospiraceae bacterium]